MKKFILKKFTLSKRHKIVGSALLGLLLIIVILFIFLKNKNINNQLTEPGSTIIKPVFLNDQEKTDLNIKPETKIQVIQKDAAGKIILYKVINNDSDIVTDLNQVEAQRPDLKK